MILWGNASQFVALQGSGDVYTSTNAGATWTYASTYTSIPNWIAITSSTDGSTLVAAESPGYIYSSADYGASWTQRGTSQDWKSIASSSDGRFLVAISCFGYVHTSADFGASWVQQTKFNCGVSVASSNDGRHLFMSDSMSFLTSTDFGVTWTNRAAGIFKDVASSSDGRIVVASSWGGFIHKSTDFGQTFEPQPGSFYPNPSYFLSLSSDGSVLAQGGYGAAIFVSSSKTSIDPILQENSFISMSSPMVQSFSSEAQAIAVWRMPSIGTKNPFSYGLVDLYSVRVESILPSNLMGWNTAVIPLNLTSLANLTTFPALFGAPAFGRSKKMLLRQNQPLRLSPGSSWAFLISPVLIVNLPAFLIFPT